MAGLWSIAMMASGAGGLHARIRDIPEELKSAEATSDRIKWLASRVPAEERARQEAMFKDIAIDLGLSS